MMADFHRHYCGQIVHVDEWDEHLGTCDPSDLEPEVYAVPTSDVSSTGGDRG